MADVFVGRFGRDLGFPLTCLLKPTKVIERLAMQPIRVALACKYLLHNGLCEVLANSVRVEIAVSHFAQSGSKNIAGKPKIFRPKNFSNISVRRHSFSPTSEAADSAFLIFERRSPYSFEITPEMTVRHQRNNG